MPRVSVDDSLKCSTAFVQRHNTLKLVILTSHPIQYQAPLFRALARQLDLMVLFAHNPAPQLQAEAGFNESFQWDTDLLAGYDSQYLDNVAEKPSLIRFDGCDSPAIGDVIENLEPDIVLVNGWHLKTYIQCTSACRRQGVPVLARTDSHLMTPRSWIKRVVKRLTYPAFLRKFDGFLTAGKLSSAYLKYYGVSENRFAVMPYCIDNTLFETSAFDQGNAASKLREQWQASENTTVLLFVGKFLGIKRPCDIIESAARLTKKGLNCRVVLVGSGPMQREIKSASNQLGVDVYMPGFVNQSGMADYYRAADLLVLPSESETWGMVVNESLACGTPAIVSDHVGCGPDLIEVGVTGAVFPVADIDALSEAIEQNRTLKHDKSQPEFGSMLSRCQPDAVASRLTIDLKQLARVRSMA